MSHQVAPRVPCGTAIHLNNVMGFANCVMMMVLRQNFYSPDAVRILSEPQQTLLCHILCTGTTSGTTDGGTAAAAPPPFRPGNPALCGSHPLVTPY